MLHTSLYPRSSPVVGFRSTFNVDGTGQTSPKSKLSGSLSRGQNLPYKKRNQSLHNGQA